MQKSAIQIVEVDSRFRGNDHTGDARPETRHSPESGNPPLGLARCLNRGARLASGLCRISSPTWQDHDKRRSCDEMSFRGAPLAGELQPAPSCKLQLHPGAHLAFATIRPSDGRLVNPSPLQGIDRRLIVGRAVIVNYRSPGRAMRRRSPATCPRQSAPAAALPNEGPKGAVA
jgi:hypothetical protein